MRISDRDKRILRTSLYVLVLLLSLALIVYISIDTFTNVNFLENRNYMRFQLLVCVVFMIDFFVELALADDKWKYVRRHWFFFLLSIPYLNIIEIFNISFLASGAIFYKIHPSLARGALALSIVIGYMTTNRISSLLMSYIVILLSVIYFASLIFL